jgi:hypothetical protein
MTTDISKRVYSPSAAVISPEAGMITDISKGKYREIFTSNPNPFISEEFIGLVEKRWIKLYDCQMKTIHPSDCLGA